MRSNFFKFLHANILSACILALGLSGCASFYVDKGTSEIPAAQFKIPAQTHPVQVLFQFETKGLSNARATEFIKADVIDQIKKSGLFSIVSESPATNGGLLSITLNNIPITDDAAAKGFATGFTLGLVGSTISDGYICTARFSGEAGTEPVLAEARHVIHTTLGASSAPANATKAEDLTQAVKTMVRQVLSNVLNNISHNPAFK